MSTNLEINLKYLFIHYTLYPIAVIIVLFELYMLRSK